MRRGGKPKKEGDGDSRLAHALNYRISMVELLLLRASGAYSKESGLTAQQWKCLAAVGVWGPMQAVHIARHATLDKAAVSRAVRQLVELKYLERRLHPRDSRMVTLALTEQGGRTFKSVARKIHDLQADLMRGVNASDKEQFFSILLLIEDRLRTLQALPSRLELDAESVVTTDDQ